MSEHDLLPNGQPVVVRGRLEEPLSRWLWLVKWLLLIPHYIVLAFLWIAFAFVTVVAFFAILFTGRYPRALFDFNLGVLRWTWRVTYYGYSALGTDRYPPFSLAERRTTRRRWTCLPERLSRGLVLVKWWLLALPHYLLLGLIVGGPELHRHVRVGGQVTTWTIARLPTLAPGVLRRGRPVVHRPLSARPVRLRPRCGPLGAPGHRLRRSDDRRVPAVPVGPGRRAHPSHLAGPSPRSGGRRPRSRGRGVRAFRQHRQPGSPNHHPEESVDSGKVMEAAELIRLARRPHRHPTWRSLHQEDFADHTTRGPTDEVDPVPGLL